MTWEPTQCDVVKSSAVSKLYNKCWKSHSQVNYGSVVMIELVGVRFVVGAGSQVHHKITSFNLHQWQTLS